MNLIEQLKADLVRDPPDDMPKDAKRLHGYYVDFLREVLALAGHDMDPAVVDVQLTADMLDVRPEALDALLRGMAKGVQTTIVTRFQEPTAAITQMLRAAVQVGYRAASDQTATAKAPAP